MATAPLEVRLGIVRLHNSETMPIEVTAESYLGPLAEVGVRANAMKVGQALKALGFEMVHEKRTRRCRCTGAQCEHAHEKRCKAPRGKSHNVIIQPRTWIRPSAWSPEVLAQLRLKDSYFLSTSQVDAATDRAHHNGEIMEKAIEIAVTSSDKPLDAPGLLKGATAAAVNDRWNNSVPIVDLASWLGEDPTVMSLGGLEARTRMMVKVATKSDRTRR